MKSPLKTVQAQPEVRVITWPDGVEVVAGALEFEVEGPGVAAEVELDEVASSARGSSQPDHQSSEVQPTSATQPPSSSHEVLSKSQLPSVHSSEVQSSPPEKAATRFRSRQFLTI